MRDVFRVWSKATVNGRYVPRGAYDTVALAAEEFQPTHWRLVASGNYVSDDIDLSFIAPERVPDTVADRVELALELIAKYGWVDGGHHRAWVLDRVARMLAGDAYEEWKAGAGKDLPEGVAP